MFEAQLATVIVMSYPVSESPTADTLPITQDEGTIRRYLDIPITEFMTEIITEIISEIIILSIP